MIVYKFGGASVKDAPGVINLFRIVKSVPQPLIIVISAFGKTTNALEEIHRLSYHNLSQSKEKLKNLFIYHYRIMDELFANKDHHVFEIIKSLFADLESKLETNEYSSFDQKYDQIISFGEIFSTQIISEYLSESGLSNQWVDIRQNLVTDNNFRDAKVDFSQSEKRIKESFNFRHYSLYVTQGFIGGAENGLVSTLGREGSDYTAALLAYFLNADEVVVWKDVEGILNADPQYFTNTVKLNQLSYQETVEMAYFGAKVIHPKTIKPLHNKNIPLKVKSFIHPQGEGTIIQCFDEYDANLPVIILKKHQVLVSLFPKDLSFVIEDALSEIFRYLSEHKIKVNLIQNSAISFSFCFDNINNKVLPLIKHLRKDYKVLYNDQLELLTIRHYTPEAVDEVTKGRKIFVEQRSRHTAHFVLK
ncbi:MAG: aspartate kinase [Bacteroidales bacterium]|jgi:aspartate kinase|nr:aspartate kinase [Bacteroidales bacterium]